MTHTKWALGGILVSAAILLAWGAVRDSLTFDESAHIPAGYANVARLDYRLNHEHPPLVKALAALPLLFVKLNFPVTDPAWTTDVNGQWHMGGLFLYESGNNPETIIRLARIGPVILSLLLILATYHVARKIIGDHWTLLPTFLMGLSPHLLAHGHLVTTDVGAALGILWAIDRMMAYWEAPSLKRLVLVILAIGVAELMKFSAVLLIPFFLVGACLYGESLSWRTRIMQIMKTGVIIIAAYCFVVYPIYGLFTHNYPVDRNAHDTAVILEGFGRGTPLHTLADIVAWGSGHRITQPFAQYATGVLSAFARSEGGNANYFLGKVSGQGHHSYFPIIYLAKEPIPLLVLLVLALGVGIRGLFRFHGNEETRKERRRILFLLGFIAFYWFMSVRSPLNIGFRHLFPTLPLTAILIGVGVKHLMRNAEGTKRKIYGIVLTLILIWYGGETAIAAPHFLSYYNEFAHGTAEGYRIATDSNYDWGQDLYALQGWLTAHPEVDRIALDYFGGGSPRETLGAAYVPWWSAKGNPAAEGISWFAVSLNALEGSVAQTEGYFERKPEDEYRWLIEQYGKPDGYGMLPEPTARAGTSIFIYRVK
jgi:hypothetical protein